MVSLHPKASLAELSLITSNYKRCFISFDVFFRLILLGISFVPKPIITFCSLYCNLFIEIS